MDLNVLMIGLDSTLAKDEDRVVGNAKARHIEYAKQLKNLYVVVKTLKSVKPKVKKVGDNLYIYPTASLNKYFFPFDAYRIAKKICRKYKINIISTQDPFITGLIGWLLKKKYNIPLNIQIAADMIDNKYFIKENILNLFFNKLAKRLIHRADTIRVSTLREKQGLILQGITEEKIHYMPFFIDFSLSVQKDDNNIRQLYLDGRFDKIALSVNRLVKQKNIETLIRAIPYTIEKYPKCLFLIVGSGPEEKRLKRLASNLGVEEFIKFQDQVCYKNIFQYFQAADIFVVTSHYEGTCMAIQEAAVSGKPIVSTSHAGAYDTIEDEKTGFILNFKDTKNIAQKIIYLLKNSDIAKEMGEKGQKFVLEHFDKDKILRDYINMFNETAKFRS